MPAAGHCRGVRQRQGGHHEVTHLVLVTGILGRDEHGRVDHIVSRAAPDTTGVWTIPARTMMWTVGGMSVNQQPCHTQAPKKGGGGRKGDPPPSPPPFLTPTRPDTYDQDLLHLADGRDPTDVSVVIITTRQQVVRHHSLRGPVRAPPPAVVVIWTAWTWVRAGFGIHGLWERGVAAPR